jgi:hypothetical protein
MLPPARDVDADYDVSQEPTGRYSTRRASAAMGARASTRLQDVQQKRKSTLGRVDSFATQQVCVLGVGRPVGVCWGAGAVPVCGRGVARVSLCGVGCVSVCVWCGGGRGPRVGAPRGWWLGLRAGFCGLPCLGDEMQNHGGPL